MTSYDLSSAHPTEAGSESEERRDARRVAFHPKRGAAAAGRPTAFWQA